jgi:DNA-binding transcriptional MerR regulator
MSATYPRKLFYKIQEVADIVGVEAYVLRYWETKFPMLQPDKDANDQRRYRTKDVDLLLRIRELLYVQKYTIAGAVEVLKGGSAKAEAAPAATTAAVPPPPRAVAPVAQDLFDEAPGAQTPADMGLPPEQLEQLRKVREELGLLRRELEAWREELG